MSDSKQANPALASSEVRIASGDVWLTGDLVLPPGSTGLVLFAHGSGSGRHSARNRQVAQRLQQDGIATLLFDLLTLEEEEVDLTTRQHRFDIPLLARRMQDATAWCASHAQLLHAAIGYFGASTGSAAALIAAARLGDRVAAVVSRGGRPDLAGPVALAAVRAPTLLIVGGADHEVLELNEQAFEHLRCEKELAVIAGATHLFEERGTLEQAADRAASWFGRHLVRSLPPDAVAGDTGPPNGRSHQIPPDAQPQAVPPDARADGMPPDASSGQSSGSGS